MIADPLKIGRTDVRVMFGNDDAIRKHRYSATYGLIISTRHTERLCGTSDLPVVPGLAKPKPEFSVQSFDSGWSEVGAPFSNGQYILGRLERFSEDCLRQVHHGHTAATHLRPDSGKKDAYFRLLPSKLRLLSVVDNHTRVQGV